MNKVVRDGKVAVLYSPGFGAGWYTWNTKYPECLFDPEIVQAVESNNKEKAANLAELKFDGFYTGGADDLEIAWLREGTNFRIEEYDGSESITVSENLFLVA